MSMTPEQQAALLAAMKKKIQIWKAAASIQIASSTISFVSSSALAVLIWRKKDGFATPYRRLIFCISISDILQSLGLLIGPFSPPKSVRQAIWSAGNDNTCTFDGLLFTFGSTWVPMYSAALSIYYFCKLHLNMTDEQFQFKVERHMHRFIIVSMIAVNIAAMAKDAINTATSGTMCLYSATPIRCRYTDYVDCDANADAAMVIGMMTTTILPFLCLFLILGFLSKLLYEIAFREKIFATSNDSLVVSQDEEMAEGAEQLNKNCTVGEGEVGKTVSNTCNEASGKLRNTVSDAIFSNGILIQYIFSSFCVFCELLLVIGT